jgi:ATP-binding cassette, subfamily B, bacterial
MQNPYLALLRTAWKYARQQRKRFVLIYALFVISNIVVATNPLFYGWFVNKLQMQGSDVLRTTWIYVAGFLGLKLLEWSFHGPARIMERELAFNVGKNFIDTLFSKVLNLPTQWHQDHHSGATISKLRKAHEALRDFFQHGFVYMYSFGKFVLSFAAMLYFSPLFGAIGVVIGAITVFIIVKFDKPLIKSQREVNSREHEVSSTLFDSLSNIVTVITLRLEQRIHTGLSKKVANVFEPFKRNIRINEWKWFVAQMMIGLIYATITFGYIYQHYTPGETFMIGGLIILLGYVNQFTSVFNDIASQYTQIMRYHTDVQNGLELEKEFDMIGYRSAASPLPPQWKQLKIENLSFSRNASSQESERKDGLNDLNIRFARGERIALIGESGSGKSTLLALLRGLYNPTTGSLVKVDNRETPFDNIGSSVTLFPQEPEIFENTLLYNITLGLPFREQEVLEVCAAAQFDKVINALPLGLHTHIQEKGVNLSGGQKQRLALARGILAARESTIVLMDEPTSSIDPLTERKIYSSLFSTFKDKAVISALHRLHLLSEFDYVYLLKDGVVIDEGTFEDLKKFSLVFKEMWEQQLVSENEKEENQPSEFPKLNVAL